MLKSVVVGVSVSLLVAGMAVAAPPEPGKQPPSSVSPAKPSVGLAPDPCPPGWHLAPGSPSSGAIVCDYNKPRPIQCPPKHEYYETFQNGKCQVGCRQLPY